MVNRFTNLGEVIRAAPPQPLREPMRLAKPLTPGFNPDPSITSVGEFYCLVTSAFESSLAFRSTEVPISWMDGDWPRGHSKGPSPDGWSVHRPHRISQCNLGD
jgi:hypothetical protein